MEGRSETMQEEMVLELARAIHSEYNRHRLLDSPDRPLEYPDWDALPEDIRNSNIRQARSIPVKLSLIGCHIGYEGAVEVDIFSRDEVEVMAKREHELWVEEREAAGWTIGPKNVELKTSPDLIPMGRAGGLQEGIRQGSRRPDNLSGQVHRHARVPRRGRLRLVGEPLQGFLRHLVAVLGGDLVQPSSDVQGPFHAFSVLVEDTESEEGLINALLRR